MQNTVVIVDDDPGICHVLEGLLLSKHSKKYAIDVMTFSRASEALPHIEVAAVIVTDIKMLPMDGLEFIRKARRLNPNAQIIVYSAFFGSDSELDIMTLDEELMDSAITKKFTLIFYKNQQEELIDAIAGFLTPR